MIAMSSPRPRPSPRKPASSVPPPVPAPPVVRPPDEAEYTERLVVPAQLVLGAVVAIVAGVILLALGLWPLAIAAVLLVAAAAYYLGTQILTVSARTISIAQGRGDKSPHLVQASEIVLGEIVELSWPQCFGFGLPDTVDTTRYTVRAGRAVSLTMRDGEELRISAADPEAVLTAFGR